MHKVIGLVICCTSLMVGGCAHKMQWVQDFETRAYTKQASKACIEHGFTMIHPEYAACESRVVAALKEQDAQLEQESWSNALAAAALVGMYYGAKGQGQAQYWSSQPAPSTPGPSVSPAYGSNNQLTVCPNGQYINGTHCYLAPDGTYHASQPQLAPDGTYVGGTPRITPNGNYIGGSGDLLICPDGSYVNGKRCVMTPDGRYLGGW